MIEKIIRRGKNRKREVRVTEYPVRIKIRKRKKVLGKLY